MGIKTVDWNSEIVMLGFVNAVIMYYNALCLYYTVLALRKKTISNVVNDFFF